MPSHVERRLVLRGWRAKAAVNAAMALFLRGASAASPAPNLVTPLWTSCTQLISNKIKARLFV
jgi:hypothetical protein